ncbi:MAG: Rieske (2Fe-2S) protein [Alphaproteobacteria bacterium]|nr:Rieske (2Fe-2S) protein [Alphaproteobacteria bacterium]
MSLPDTVTALGAQLDAGGAITPAPDLFAAHDVFAAELPQIFVRPWMAVDHASRLAEDGRWFRCDAANRSVAIVRESAEQIHALRNVCLHAGYRICEEDEGRSERLLCIYHGWEYALDGRLTDPLLRPELTDRSRYRLARYGLRVSHGLILLDLSAPGPAPQPAPFDDGTVPADLAELAVIRRHRFATSWNWKYVRQLLRSSPQLFLPAGDGAMIEYGPLSLLMRGAGQTVLLRINPKFPGQTDFEAIWLAPAGTPEPAGVEERVGEALRQTGDAISAAPLAWLGRDFYDWYWPLMAPVAAA